MTEATPFPSDAHPRLAARTRIWSKACLMISSTFGSEKPSSHYRKLAAAVAQLRNVGLSRNRMLKTEFSRRSIA